MDFIKEFFEDDGDQASMTRLIMFGTFLVTSMVMLMLAWDGKMSEGYLTIYMTINTSAYAYGKKKDSDVAVATTHAQTTTTVASIQAGVTQPSASPGMPGGQV